MRDILFRGQTRRKGEYIVNMAGDKCESHWVYGGIFPQNKDGDFAIIYQQEPEIRKFTVYAETVGQYTGLTDKNGVKIFEGDICRFKRFNDVHIGKIVFNATTASFVMWYQPIVGAYGEKATQKMLLSVCDDIEVIGNIHDNPELLGGENNGINR